MFACYYATFAGLFLHMPSVGEALARFLSPTYRHICSPQFTGWAEPALYVLGDPERSSSHISLCVIECNSTDTQHAELETAQWIFQA